MSFKTQLGKTFNMNFSIFLLVCAMTVSVPPLCQYRGAEAEMGSHLQFCV